MEIVLYQTNRIWNENQGTALASGWYYFYRIQRGIMEGQYFLKVEKP